MARRCWRQLVSVKILGNLAMRLRFTIRDLLWLTLLLALVLGWWFDMISFGMGSKRKIIGGTIGGFLGLTIPFLLAGIYVWQGGDPTAAGAFSFFPIITIPLGIGIGVAVGSTIRKE